MSKLYFFVSHKGRVLPVTIGCRREFRVVRDVIFGVVTVRITPALVPTHKRSLQTIKQVNRRQADLCWRMISSQSEKITMYSLYERINLFEVACTPRSYRDKENHPLCNTPSSNPRRVDGISTDNKIYSLMTPSTLGAPEGQNQKHEKTYFVAFEE